MKRKQTWLPGLILSALFTQGLLAQIKWEAVPGGLSQISGATDGTVWGVNNIHAVYSFDRSAATWKKMPGAMSWVAVGSATNIWGLNASDGTIFQWVNNAWKQVPGNLTRISAAADGAVFGVNAADQIWQWDAAKGQWNMLTGALTDVAAESGTKLWGANKQGQVWLWTAGTWALQTPGAFTTTGTSVSGGPIIQTGPAPPMRQLSIWPGQAAKGAAALVGTTTSDDAYVIADGIMVILDKKLRYTAGTQGEIWAIAPDGTISRGTLAASGQATGEEFCWKANYIRGGGSPPTACPTGMVEQDGLCYQACPSGYYGVGPLCWQSCPSGYSDFGVSCIKPAATTSAGYGWQYGDPAFDYDTGERARCEAANGAGNCYRSGLIWYPKCKANFHKVGDLVCSPDCPNGMRDDGAFCAKSTSARGAGTGMTCSSGTVSDPGGLCYPACFPDFTGVASVCWGVCGGTYPYTCGAGCATNSITCNAAAADMVLNTVGAAVGVLSMVAGGPGVTAAAKSAAKAGELSAQASLRAGMKPITSATFASMRAYGREYAKTFVKVFLKNQLVPRNLYFKAWSANKFFSLQAVNQASQQFAQLKDDNTFDFGLFTALDPTGISSAILSFAKYSTCGIEPLRVDTTTLDFGAVTQAATKTLTLKAQAPVTVTSITSTALTNCKIDPRSTCIGRTLQIGQTCTVDVSVLAPNMDLDSELRIYTTEYDSFPLPVLLKANAGAAQQCAVAPDTTADEAINMTALQGAWLWFNDVRHKISIDGSGKMQPWGWGTAPGTVQILDPIQRTIQIDLNAASNGDTFTLSPLGDKIMAGTRVMATKRRWDTGCAVGLTLYAGLCYDTAPGFEIVSPGLESQPCPTGWRDDGTNCWPKWIGPPVWAQADPSPTSQLRYPMVVTSCEWFGPSSGNQCPTNFGTPVGCSCFAKNISKNLTGIVGGPMSPTQ